MTAVEMVGNRARRESCKKNGFKKGNQASTNRAAAVKVPEVSPPQSLVAGRPIRNCKRRSTAEMLGAVRATVTDEESRSPPKKKFKQTPIPSLASTSPTRTAKVKPAVQKAIPPRQTRGERAAARRNTPSSTVVAASSEEEQEQLTPTVVLAHETGILVESDGESTSNQTTPIKIAEAKASIKIVASAGNPLIVKTTSEGTMERAISSTPSGSDALLETINARSEPVQQQAQYEEIICQDEEIVSQLSENQCEISETISQPQQLISRETISEPQSTTESVDPEETAAGYSELERTANGQEETLSDGRPCEITISLPEDGVAGDAVYTQVKTYMLDKNNQLQEVLSELQCQSSLAGSSNEPEENVSSREEFLAEEEEEASLAGEADEDTITQEEGLGDDAELFDNKVDDKLIDEAMKAVYETIQPTDNIEDHYERKCKYVCNYCEETWKNLRAFVTHLKNAHKPDFAPWACPICPFKCSYPASIKMHLNVHAVKKPYNCTICNRGFAYKQRYRLHMKYHNDVRDYKCPCCPLSFHEPKTLKTHMERYKHLVGVKSTMTITSSAGKPQEPSHSPILHVGRDPLTIMDMPEAEEDISSKDMNASVPISLSNTGTEKQEQLEQSLQLLIDQTTVTGETAAVQGVQVSGNDSSVVQILPVSVNNDSGVPETINVVITVPSSEAMKKPSKIRGTTKTTKMTNNYRQSIGLEPLPGSGVRPTTNTKSRGQVDVELLPYCELLDAPQLWNGAKTIMKCKLCPVGNAEQFQSTTQFCEHLKKEHGDMNIKPYKCSQCDYSCRIKGNLDQHVKFHAAQRPFMCHLCNKGFIQKYKLNLHLQYHANKREWKCDQCTSAFNDKQDLSRHMKNVHFPLESAVLCPECERPFKNKRLLDQHMHVHTGAREYQCDVCDKHYSTRESLRSHMKGHQFQFGCEICAKPLGSYSAFIAHKRLHDPNQKGYECDICGKVLLFKATLESHKLSVHSNVRPHKCSECDRGFKTRGQLQNHQISHSKEKPYNCQICGYAVKRRDSLRQHMFRHAEVKPFRCGRCGKEYTQKQALEIHLKSKHAGVSTFNCTMCERGFNTNYLLKKHMMKTHNLDLITRMEPSDKVIIAQQHQEEEDAPDSDKKLEIDGTSGKKQTVLINAHICEHCNEVFVSQHALAVHILTDHMNQKWVASEGSAGTSNHAEDAIDISETIEIPIGEEMVIVQSVDPGMLSDALDHGATRLTNANRSSTGTGKVSLLPSAKVIEEEMTIEHTDDTCIEQLVETEVVHTETVVE